MLPESSLWLCSPDCCGSHDGRTACGAQEMGLRFCRDLGMKQKSNKRKATFFKSKHNGSTVVCSNQQDAQGLISGDWF